MRKKMIKRTNPVEENLWDLLRSKYISERQLHEVGMWCWEEIARPIWEKHHPDDRRPHDAIATKRLWLDGKATDAELASAQTVAIRSTRDAALNISNIDVRIFEYIAALNDSLNSVQISIWTSACAAAENAVVDVVDDFKKRDIFENVKERVFIIIIQYLKNIVKKNLLTL